MLLLLTVFQGILIYFFILISLEQLNFGKGECGSCL